MEDFRNLDRDIESNSKRWRKFIEGEAPEKEKFPQEWKKKDALQASHKTIASGCQRSS